VSLTPVEPEAVLAWVESPFQLLGALEAHAGGHLGRELAVLPRAGSTAQAATVTELERLGLPSGAGILAPDEGPRPYSGVLAAGDVFSGKVQRLLVQRAPARVVLLDDGRATRRVMDALSGSGVPLIRPHVVASPPRAILAKLALMRLKRMAAQGRLRVVTALPLPDSVVAAAELAGVRVQKHSFSWLRALPGGGAPRHNTVVLGSSMVANDLIAAQPYLDWVRDIARSGPVSYRAHRREDERTLAPLRAMAGVDVESGEVPVELSLRGMTDRQHVLTLPTTAVSTLRLITPQAHIQEFAVPATWWQPSVPPVARMHLVPDDEKYDPQAYSHDQ
jgi:hypothetical protein